MSRKETGLSGLKQIPTHWQKTTIRAITKPVVRRDRPDLPLLSVYRDYGIIPKGSREGNHNRDGEDLSSYKVVRPGNLVLNKMKTWQGSLGVSELEGIVSPAYIICELDNDLNGRFIHYLLRSKPYIFEYNRISYGVRVDQWDMRYDDFKQIPIFLPPRPEQDAIVAFLDEKLADIDRYIAAKQRLIALLNEQKAALINQAVTRGLDGAIAMKESGIEWLGAVPAHWEVTKLKYLFRENDDRSKTGEETLFSLRMHQGLIEHHKVSDKPVTNRELIGYKRTYPGEIVMNRMRAAIGLFGLTHKFGLVSPDYAIFQPIKSLHQEYYIHLFKSSTIQTTFRLESKGLGTGSSGFLRLYSDRFGRIKVPYPPYDEQQQIIEYIHQQSLNFEDAISKTNREIELMQELRTTLIAEAVTGKVDINVARKGV